MHGPAPESQLVQPFLPMFAQHEIDAWVAHELKLQKSREKSREKRQVKAVWLRSNSVKTQAIDNLSDDLLNLPLGGVADPELSDLGDPYVEQTCEEPTVSCDADEKFEWNSAAIEQLHEAVVMYSLRLLKAKGNAKEKREVISWIFDPPAMALSMRLDDGRKVWRVFKPSEAPFSFDVCCRAAGYNPERLREGLVPVLKSLGLDILFKEIGSDRNSHESSRSEELPDSLDIQHSRGAGKCDADGSQGGHGRSAEDRSELRV